MDQTTLNRPLAGYLIVQSSLVLIVLAASHVLHSLMIKTAGVAVPHLPLALILVLLTQLPLAVLFARSEARNLTSSEGWVLGATFIGVTVLAEGGMQALMGRIWLQFAADTGLTKTAGVDALVFATCVTLLFCIAVAFLINGLFRLAVRNNLASGGEAVFARPRGRDFAGIFRRNLTVFFAGLVGVGIALAGSFGLEVMVFALPAAIVFGIFTVALEIARGCRSRSYLRVALDLMPMTLVAIVALVATMAGLAVIRAGGDAAALRALLVPAIAGLGQATLIGAVTKIGTIALLALCTNIVLLAVFVAAIRPLANSARNTADATKADARVVPTPKKPRLIIIRQEDASMADTDTKTTEQPAELGETVGRILRRVQKPAPSSRDMIASRPRVEVRTPRPPRSAMNGMASA